MTSGQTGVFAVEWGQTCTDDWANAPGDMLSAGASWAWQGPALRLDGPPGVLPLAAAGRALPVGSGAIARHRIGGPRHDLGGHKPVLPGEFSVTDGHEAWCLRRLETGAGRALAVFDAGLPPEGKPLSVVEAVPTQRRPDRMIVPGLLADTCVMTEAGTCKAADLQPGMRLRTRSGGWQSLAGVSLRRISAARLALVPDLRPIWIPPACLGPDRPDAALRVSPRQRLLLSGPAIEALFGVVEALVAASDLLALPGVTRARPDHSVTYAQLDLGGDELVLAEGVWCATGDVASAELRRLSQGETAMLAAPGAGPLAGMGRHLIG